MNRLRLTACALAIGIAQAATARAQTDTFIFGLVDNSFFVEESFNQDSGVFQNLFLWSRNTDGEWQAIFSQEWPLHGHAHQWSYSIPWNGGGGPAHLGQATLSYRYQLMDEGVGRPAISPRVTVLLPTFRDDDDGERPGLQINVPVSKEAGHLYLHGNAGFTWTTGVATGAGDARTNLTSPHIGGSVIWAARPMLQLMLESVAVFEQSVDGAARTTRDVVMTLSPGVRGGWDVGSGQIVIGAAIPITSVHSERGLAALGYFSYEGPFIRR